MKRMKLRPIDRTDADLGRLNAALKIYQETILPEAQNPVKQILYWIEHGKSELTDQFRCFSLLDGDAVIGYLQYSYFAEEHIFFLEYLCVRDRRRAGMVPSPALKCIEEYLAENYRPGFTVVFEIAKRKDPTGSWQTDERLIKYFERLGFRTIDFDYHYPVLQSYEGAGSYPADLMVRLPDARTAVSASEMRTILRSIYFKHYLRWDKPFLDDGAFHKREQLINELYSREASRIKGDDTFNTTGDDRRSIVRRLSMSRPNITALLEKIFAPKMPRIMMLLGIMLFAEWFLGSVFYLIPLVLAVSALFCLAEDTVSSRKLFIAILAKFSSAQRRTS